jgi:hypothetical protein
VRRRRQPAEACGDSRPRSHRGPLIALVLLAALGPGACGTASSASHTNSRGAGLNLQLGASPARGARSVVPARYERQVASLLTRVIRILSRPPAPGRNHYYSGGVWSTVGSTCWRCDVAAGVVAAELANRSQSDRRDRQLGIETFDAAISHHRQSDGSFGPGLGGEGNNNQISTVLMTNFLSLGYLQLHPWLDRGSRSRWLHAIYGAGVWLERVLGFYVNGNVNLDQTLTMYLAWRATGDRRFRADYERSLQFTLHPTGSRWTGFGLQYLKHPNRPDGSDGAGYLAEKGAANPGFDPHYTIVQSDVAATLYAVSRDPRVLSLLNLLTNALLTRTNIRTLVIDTTGGSRRPNASSGYLESPSLAVLALTGSRTDLLPLLGTQFAEVRVAFPNYAMRATDQDGVIGDFGSILLAVHPPS